MRTLAISEGGNRESNNCPTLDCNAATRKLPLGSEEARSLSSMSCTPALQRLHFPSNRIMGRESAELKIEGMAKRGGSYCCFFLVEDDCFLMFRPKSVYVGGGDNGKAIMEDAANDVVVAGRGEEEDNDVDLLDDEWILVFNDPNCLIHVVGFTEANASADDMMTEKHVATAMATLIILLLMFLLATGWCNNLSLSLSLSCNQQSEEQLKLMLKDRRSRTNGG